MPTSSECVCGGGVCVWRRCVCVRRRCVCAEEVCVCGGSAGGRMIAHLLLRRSFSDKRWYCFNDQSVTRVS